MQIQHSRDAQRLLSDIKEKGRLRRAAAIYNLPLPHERWWSIISNAARKSNEPYWEAVKELAKKSLTDPSMPSWPTGLYETADELPPINRDEALAILDRFMRAEFNDLTAGVLLYKLHWDVLAAEYCPLQERYTVLQELVDDGLLKEAANGRRDAEANVYWPLTVAGDLIDAIERSRIRAKLPFLSRLERWLDRIWDTYPRILQVLAWLLAGVGLNELIRFVTNLW